MNQNKARQNVDYGADQENPGQCGSFFKEHQWGKEHIEPHPGCIPCSKDGQESEGLIVDRFINYQGDQHGSHDHKQGDQQQEQGRDAIVIAVDFRSALMEIFILPDRINFGIHRINQPGHHQFKTNDNFHRNVVNANIGCVAH